MSSPFPRPLDLVTGRVDAAFGAGGRAMTQLVEEVFLAAFNNPLLAEGNDQAIFPAPRGRLALATDSFVVTPRVFPGGDIGRLAVHGTINDLAMGGAMPIALSAAFVLEEGLPLAEVAATARSMAEAAREAGVPIVTGDTKVVERGGCDGLFITTTGVGVIADDRIRLSCANLRPGDRLVINGTLGDHGIAVLSQRENLAFEAPVVSDSAALHDLVAAMLAAVPDIRAMRDPTRGGLAATLNEWARQAGVGLHLDEAALPIDPAVQGACDMLGLDPLTIANEGKLIAACPPDRANDLLAVMRAHPLGRKAALIGEVLPGPEPLVQMTTPMGGRRVIDWLAGGPLPRIC